MQKKFKHSTIRNPSNARQEPDGAILVDIEILYDDSEEFSPALYCCRREDMAPANLWLLDLIDSGALPLNVMDDYSDEQYWQSVRAKRNELLAESDIYVLPDRWAAMTPSQQQAWASYRQALRDITMGADPRNVVWPEKPQ